MIAGFIGWKRSGKLTAASALVSAGYSRMAFADPLKQVVRLLVVKAGVTPGRVERYLREDKEVIIPEIGRSVRDMAQTLGTEWGRERVHPDFWVILAKSALKNRAEIGEIDTVFEDVRFENEAALIREMGGMVIHVSRPGLVDDDLHQSEAGIAVADTDLHIDNHSDPDALRRAVMVAVEMWAAK